MPIHKVVVVANSDHLIQSNQPRAVIDAIHEVALAAARHQIDAVTGFSSMFRELRSGKVHDNPSCILARRHQSGPRAHG